MADLGAQRTAIAAALDDVSGLRVNAEGLWPDTMNLPSALVRPADDNRPLAMDFTSWLEHYEIVIVASLASGLTRGQRSLDDLYDSVVSALIAGLAGALINVNRQSYGVLEIDNIQVMGAVLRLEMIA